MGALTSERPLWPAFSGPATSAEVERVPLSERGLPASTYELVRRAAELGPTARPCRCCPTPSTFTRPSSGRSRSWLRDVHRVASRAGRAGRDAAVTPSRSSRSTARTCSRCCWPPRRSGSTRRSIPGLTRWSTRAELVRLSGAKVIAASGPELDAGVWARAREIAQPPARERCWRCARPPHRANRPPLEPLPGGEVAYLQERMAGADGIRPARTPPRPRTTSPATCTPAARPARRSSPRGRTPTRSPTPG